MLELEVFPGRSLGCDRWEWVLGMHISQAIAIMQQEVDTIKEVDVFYSEINPLESDLVLSLGQDGIKLVFDPINQRLKIIEILQLKKVQLRYCDTIFNDVDVLPSIEMIDHAFGPTHPGVYDAEKQLFTLSFRGLSFHFPVDAKYQPQYAHGLGSFQFPNGASPTVSKLFIFCGSGANVAAAQAPDLPLCCFANSTYLKRCSIISSGPPSMSSEADAGRNFQEASYHHGLDLEVLVEDTSSGILQHPSPGGSAIKTVKCRVQFGDHCQDVMSKLGAPARVFYKQEDKMRIHGIRGTPLNPGASLNNASPESVQPPQSDFFFNYFTLGFDVLFDAETNRAKKFILHTNYPGHCDFNIYHRCYFELNLSSSFGGRPASVAVTAVTKWDTLSESVRASTKPVVLHRANSSSAGNPFGSTFCYGYQNVIFEVMANGHIASLTLYQNNQALPE